MYRSGFVLITKKVVHKKHVDWLAIQVTEYHYVDRYNYSKCLDNLKYR